LCAHAPVVSVVARLCSGLCRRYSVCRVGVYDCHAELTRPGPVWLAMHRLCVCWLRAVALPSGWNAVAGVAAAWRGSGVVGALATALGVLAMSTQMWLLAALIVAIELVRPHALGEPPARLRRISHLPGCSCPAAHPLLRLRLRLLCLRCSPAVREQHGCFFGTAAHPMSQL
jgi:hypothetical protein